MSAWGLPLVVSLWLFAMTVWVSLVERVRRPAARTRGTLAIHDMHTGGTVQTTTFALDHDEMLFGPLGGRWLVRYIAPGAAVEQPLSASRPGYLAGPPPASASTGLWQPGGVVPRVNLQKRTVRYGPCPPHILVAESTACQICGEETA